MKKKHNKPSKRPNQPKRNRHGVKLSPVAYDQALALREFWRNTACNTITGVLDEALKRLTIEVFGNKGERT